VVQHKHYNVLSPVFLEVFKHTNYNCYPNAGVMLVDQQRFNQLKLLERIEQLIKLNKVEFIYRLGSQPLVTLTTWGRYISKINTKKMLCFCTTMGSNPRISCAMS